MPGWAQAARSRAVDRRTINRLAGVSTIMNELSRAVLVKSRIPRSESELQRIVLLNEQIKAVVATAFSINLMALNAIFLAKRAGQAALGFGVLSNELRGFSVDLADVMKTLRNMTSDSVSVVSDQVRRSRIPGDSAAPQGQAVFHAHSRRSRRPSLATQAEVERHAAELRERQRRLRQVLADVRQRVELGGVLARSAKIEAAYGGSFAQPLMQVSSDFDKTIDAIRGSLDSLAAI